MDFDDEAIGSCGKRGPCHRRDERAHACAVARICDDGQVGELFEGWDRVEIEGVSGVGFKGPNASFASDDVWIAFA